MCEFFSVLFLHLTGLTADSLMEEKPELVVLLAENQVLTQTSRRWGLTEHRLNSQLIEML